MSEAYREITGGGNVQPINKRGTRWPQNASVPEEWLELGHKARRDAGLPRINLKLEADKFCDFWTSKSGQGALKLNWLATWRNWCRNARGQPEQDPHVSAGPGADMDVRYAALLKNGITTFQAFGPQLVARCVKKGYLTADEARRVGY